MVQTCSDAVANSFNRKFCDIIEVFFKNLSVVIN